MPLLPRDLNQLAPSPDPSPGRPPHCRACRPRAHATLRPRPPRCAGCRYRSHGGQSRGAGAAGDGAGLEPTAPRVSPPLLCARRAASGTRPSSPQIARPGETDTCLPPAPVRPQEGPTSPRTWSSAGRPHRPGPAPSHLSAGGLVTWGPRGHQPPSLALGLHLHGRRGQPGPFGPEEATGGRVRARQGGRWPHGPHHPPQGLG